MRHIRGPGSARIGTSGSRFDVDPCLVSQARRLRASPTKKKMCRPVVVLRLARLGSVRPFQRPFSSRP